MDQLAPVAAFETTMAAPATAAPLESYTVPVSAPSVPWANTLPRGSKQTTMIKAILVKFRMDELLFQVSRNYRRSRKSNSHDCPNERSKFRTPRAGLACAKSILDLPIAKTYELLRPLLFTFRLGACQGKSGTFF